MARIRTIKPEFWTDETIVRLPFDARLLFIGLWNHADDEGYIYDEPDRIKMQIFPSDQVDVSYLLDLLCDASLLSVYCTEDSRRIFNINNFLKHQKIDKPSNSKIAREISRKVSITSSQRRSLALKYGCSPGNTEKANCYYCGIEGFIIWHKNEKGPSSWVQFRSLEIDHLVPESKGGSGDSDNLVLACRTCNRSKHDKYFMDYINKIRGVLPESSRAFETEGKGMERKVDKTISCATFEKNDEIEELCPWEDGYVEPELQSFEFETETTESTKVTESTRSVKVRKSYKFLSANPSYSKKTEAAKRVLTFLTEKTGIIHRIDQPCEKLDMVIKCFNTGASEDDMRSVIAMKFREWSDNPEMFKYLKPSTLFAPRNFRRYLTDLGEM